VRLDKYLKVSRLIKRRTLAKEACGRERILVGGRIARASYEVKLGDIIEVPFGPHRRRVEVLSLREVADKAGAAAMYRELE